MAWATMICITGRIRVSPSLQALGAVSDNHRPLVPFGLIVISSPLASNVLRLLSWCDDFQLPL